MVKRASFRDSRNGRARSVSALLILAALAACTEGVPFRGSVSALPSRVLQLSWARASRTDKGIVVTGQIQQVHCCALRVGGHMHFEAKNSAGVTVAAADTKWDEFIARQLHSAYFKALLPVPITTSVSAVEIHFITVAGPGA